MDPDAFLGKIGDALDRGDVEAAKDLARDTRGPVASIVYQGLLRLDQGPDVVERSIVSYGGVQSGLLERNLPGSHCLSRLLRRSVSWEQ